MMRRCTRFTSVVVFLMVCAALVSVINVFLRTKLHIAYGPASGLYFIGYRSRGDLSLEFCQAVPDLLVGRLNIDLGAALKSPPPPALQDVLVGGAWSPKICVARQRIAIIIHFRDRQKHLDILVYNLIPVMKRQKVSFRIFVVEQYGNKTFNKGRLMNIGFTEARKHGEFDCFIFHDVDLVPEDDRNMYTCSENPRHMSPAVDKFNYTLPYKALVGGVLSIKAEHFFKINGYSNLYWGWGAEDDDLHKRLLASKISVDRPPITIGRYKMIKHDRKDVSQVRLQLLKTAKTRYLKDGLNTLEYKLVETRLEKLYTRIIANVGDPPKNQTEYPKTDVGDPPKNQTEHPKAVLDNPPTNLTEYSKADEGDPPKNQAEYPKAGVGDPPKNQTEHPKAVLDDPPKNRTEYPKADEGDSPKNRTEFPKADVGDPKSNQTENPIANVGDPPKNQTEHPIAVLANVGDPPKNQTEHPIADLGNPPKNRTEYPKADVDDQPNNQIQYPKADVGDPPNNQTQYPIADESDPPNNLM
ncbi:BRE4-like protein [Mya arenaria]|uniref:BRE4-like protein n=1 Tax=Mya arenaria TaxID=6604 RepID=A0ABY7EAY5_MYAAR|nr:BRE4-like protein [Mya arenaria]